jgi:hypothetical protein
MHSRRLLAPTLAVALLLATSQLAVAQPVDDGGVVIDTFQRARASGDLSGALAQFADDAVVTIQAGRATQVFAGRDQVRAYLQTVAMPARALMHSAYRVDGPYVRWTERDEEVSKTSDAMVQATVQSGRISMLLLQQTEAFGAMTATPRAAPEQPTAAPSLAWAMALGSGFMLLLGLVFRPRRRSATSRLSGRLVRAMRSYHGGRV